MRKIFEQAAAFGNFFKQAAARGKIFFMRLQMAGQFADLRREDGDLHLRRAGVGRVRLKFFDDLLLGAFIHHISLRSAESDPAKGANRADRQVKLLLIKSTIKRLKCQLYKESHGALARLRGIERTKLTSGMVPKIFFVHAVESLRRPFSPRRLWSGVVPRVVRAELLGREPGARILADDQRATGSPVVRLNVEMCSAKVYPGRTDRPYFLACMHPVAGVY